MDMTPGSHGGEMKMAVEDTDTMSWIGSQHEQTRNTKQLR